MIIIADQILLYRKIHVLLLLLIFVVMLYSSFVMNILEKIPRAVIDSSVNFIGSYVVWTVPCVMILETRFLCFLHWSQGLTYP
jgi:hypothetical protein